MTRQTWIETVRHAIDEFSGTDGPLLPVLHRIQDTIGYVPPEALQQIADALGVTRAEVHGVVSFYHGFRNAPPADHIVKICRAEACQALGAQALVDGARIKPGETAANGKVQLEEVFCLGLCACGPAGLVDGQPVGRLDAQRLDDILVECGA